MIPYDICRSLSDLLHLVWQPLGPLFYFPLLVSDGSLHNSWLRRFLPVEVCLFLFCKSLTVLMRLSQVPHKGEGKVESL